MTELDLYKFLNDDDNGVQEYRWEGDEFLVWIPFNSLDDFTKIIGCDYLSEGGYDCNLQNDCICIDIADVCEYYDINLEHILKKPKECDKPFQ